MAYIEVFNICVISVAYDALMSYFSAQMINFFYLNFHSSYSQLLLNKVKRGKTIQLGKLAKCRDNIQGFGLNDWIQGLNYLVNA